MKTYSVADGAPGDFHSRRHSRTGLRNDELRDPARRFTAGRRRLPTSPSDAVRPRLSPIRSERADQAAHPQRVPTREPAHAR